MGSEPWNFSGRRMTSHDSSPLDTVVRACGLDPDVTTTQEMEDADFWVECVRCSGGQGQLVMRWKTAVCAVSSLGTIPAGINNLWHRCLTPVIMTRLWKVIGVLLATRIVSSPRQSMPLKWAMADVGAPIGYAFTVARKTGSIRSSNTFKTSTFCLLHRSLC
jgi:hypothetical protein